MKIETEKTVRFRPGVWIEPDRSPFDTRCKLKPVAESDNTAAVVSAVPENQPRLALAAAPLAIVFAVALFTLAGRASQNVTKRLLNASAPAESLQAKAVASSVLSRITDQTVPSDDLQFSELTAFSVRHNSAIKEWNVSQEVEGQRQYLFRINAATGCVYAINRGMPIPVDAQTKRSMARQRVSADQAKILAMHYLKISGVEPKTVTFVANDHSRTRAGLGQNEDEPAFQPDDYSMSFRRRIPGVGSRLLKIGVSRTTGELEYYWNPSAAM